MKRSKSTQLTIDALNSILALDEVYVTEIETGYRKNVYVRGNSASGQLYKQAICDAMEVVLHKTKSYKGYMFLNVPDWMTDPKAEVSLNETFNRKYF
jgi:hypothetical protein